MENKKELKELNIKEVNDKAEIDKQLSVFYNQLNFINNSLDIIRNRFFNLITTRMYIKSVNFDFQTLINKINNNIDSIDKDYIEIVNSLNINFGDKSNEINEFIEKNYSDNNSEKLDKETNEKTIKNTKKENQKTKIKIKEEQLLCSELNIHQKITEQNSTD